MDTNWGSVVSEGTALPVVSQSLPCYYYHFNFYHCYIIVFSGAFDRCQIPFHGIFYIENTHLLHKGKYHCTAGLVLKYFGFDQTSKSVVNLTISSKAAEASECSLFFLSQLGLEPRVAPTKQPLKHALRMIHTSCIGHMWLRWTVKFLQRLEIFLIFGNRTVCCSLACQIQLV